MYVNETSFKNFNLFHLKDFFILKMNFKVSLTCIFQEKPVGMQNNSCSL